MSTNPPTAAAAAITTPKIPTTPDLRSLPDTGWDDTPQSLNLSPRTPDSTKTPSKELFAKNEVYDTPTRSVKEPRRSNRLKAKAARQHDATKTVSPKIEYSDLKPAPLFPHALYPALPATTIEHTTTFDLVKGDIGQRSFKFRQWSRELQNQMGQKFDDAEVAVPTRMYAFQNMQEPKRMRIRQVVSEDEENFQHTRITVAGPQTTLIEAKSVARNPSKRSNSTCSAHNATSKRFSRILPMDVVERLIEDPTHCVASYITRPHERCSEPILSHGDAKSWLATKKTDLEDSSDLIASRSYIAELVKTTTCTRTHRKIATDQLGRLLDRYRNRYRKNSKSQHDFKNRDMEALQSWLVAWTKQPDSQSLQQPKQECAMSRTAQRVIVRESQIVSNSFCEDVSGDNSKTQSSVARVEIITGATDAIALATRENLGTTVDSFESNEISETTKRVEATETVGEIETSRKDHVYQAVRSFETIKITETAYNACPEGGNHSIGAEGEIITVTNITETTSTSETAIESTGSKQHVEKTSAVTTSQRVKTVSKFRPPPVDNIKFMAGPWNSARKSLRVEERLINAHAIELQTLRQRFTPFIRSIHLSIQEYIHKCLVKPLTKREWFRPIKYPKQAFNYPGQGLIYMYWLPGNFGYVKIGKTSGESTKARLEKWPKQCGHPTEEHTYGEEEVAIQLPHVFRVEALVHAELRDFGIEEVSCKKCKRKHKEWFRVSPSHAQKVITKWSNWMENRKPYIEIDGVWRLRREINAQEIHALCTPIGVSSRQDVALPTAHRDKQTKTPAKRVKSRQKST